MQCLKPQHQELQWLSRAEFGTDTIHSELRLPLMKIVTLVGARPQFVKAAAVARAITSRGDIRHVLIHTGQHYDANMSDIFFSELDIQKPERNLDIGPGKHG